MEQTVLITGANRGIGLGLVHRYRERDARVVACCRKPEAADALRQFADSQPEGAVALETLDVTDPESVAALASRLDGPIDVLINNAGVYGPRDRQSLGSVDYDAWLEVLRANTLGPVRVIEALADRVAASERKLIATVTSQMGSIGDASGGSYLYRTSKSAVNMAMVALGNDLRHRGVTVILLHPGWVQTDMGGPSALIGVEESTRGMARILDRATLEESGRFFNQRGETLPW